MSARDGPSAEAANEELKSSPIACSRTSGFMASPVRGSSADEVSGSWPGWPVVALTTVAVVVFLGFSVSTQGPGSHRRIVRVNGYDAIEGEVLLKYRDDRVASSHVAIETAADADTVESLGRGRGVQRLRRGGSAPRNSCRCSRRIPTSSDVEPNYLVRALPTPNDPSFGSLWGLFNNGVNPIGGGGVPAGILTPRPRGTWRPDRARTSSPSSIRVSTTTIRISPPTCGRLRRRSSDGRRSELTCQAGTHGFNAITRTCDPMDDHYHGTHVAGTIGARGNNGVGVVGVNWITSMMAVKFLGTSGRLDLGRGGRIGVRHAGQGDVRLDARRQCQGAVPQLGRRRIRRRC